MTRLLNLFVLLAPWAALLGGAGLVGLAGLHLFRLCPLPGIPSEQTLSPLAALIFGLALLGLGVTFLVTDGAVGYSGVYLAWLAVAAFSGVLTAVGSR
ncbi:MAG: hypothetical protein H0V86_05095 [Chloroflexia bacterium]|nr:hypothetical protein [Chloroflexia bacterium]